MIAPDPFERGVLEKLLAGEYEPLRILRSQLAHASVARREMTGVGFFTYFHFASEITRLAERRSIIFGDVQAAMPGLHHGVGFLLYVSDGALNMLEGYACDEPWPASIDGFELSYETGGDRELAKIVEIFSTRPLNSPRCSRP